jgi:MFS superfamily sulfate permease-like transporter
MQIVPKTGFKGLVENWQSDLLASISVSLVALPLGLAVAFASGFEPISGIISAIIGGIVATLFRGSYIGINGPAAGLIAVILTAIASLDDGSGQALNYTLAVFFISGALQVILGILKLGRFADIFHPTVIRGILAGIGIIIVAKQIHLALGTEATSTKIIDDLISVVTHFKDINPFVAIISLMGLVLLVWHSKISYKLFHFLPAPIWVLLLSLPLVYLFNFFVPHSIEMLGNAYEVGPDLLVNIPDNLAEAIIHPNFSKIYTLTFWLAVISVTMVSTIITLASSKAVDKLDPYKRRTNLNKDLIGVGLATMVSGAIGGLPIVTVIVRSTVNVNNHAKTKWSNFYHGILLIMFVFIMAPFIQQVPLAALAILLVYNGFKLASPRVFRQVYKQGVEQVIYFVATIILVIFTDILTGIIGGLLLALIVHFAMAKLSFSDFFNMIFNSGTKMKIQKDGKVNIELKGITNFLGTLRIDKIYREVPEKSNVLIDLSGSRLIDLSILELTYEFERTHESLGGKVEIIGLENHISSSFHKLAMRLNTKDSKQKLTSREKSIHIMAMKNGWDYSYDPVSDLYFESFYFFKSRPIEFKSNVISGTENNMDWEVSDVTFDEGAYLALEEYQTTVEMIKLPFSIPKFTIERKGLLDKYIKIKERKDIDYQLYPTFSSKFKVKVEDKKEMDDFLSKGLRELIEESDIHHIESNGEAILIFNAQMRLARQDEYEKIINFSADMRKLLW